MRAFHVGYQFRVGTKEGFGCCETYCEYFDPTEAKRKIEENVCADVGVEKETVSVIILSIFELDSRLIPKDLTASAPDGAK